MKAKLAVIIATLYLITYVALFNTALSLTVLSYLFLTSPIVLILMVYMVLKDKSSSYPELRDNEEWGYRDKGHEELDIF